MVKRANTVHLQREGVVVGDDCRDGRWRALATGRRAQPLVVEAVEAEWDDRGRRDVGRVLFGPAVVADTYQRLSGAGSSDENAMAAQAQCFFHISRKKWLCHSVL